jgi:ParB/RepB/Spo0J family partition protein
MGVQLEDRQLDTLVYLNPVEDICVMSKPQTELLHIPLANIRENPVALRPVDKTGEKYLGMLDSVKQHGIINPINVREIDPAPDGTKLYSVCDGLHRFTAANDAGLPSIPAQVITKTDAEAEEAQIIANFHKVETKPAEFSKQLNRIILRNSDLTMVELSGRLNMTSQKLSELMSLVKLSEPIQKLVDEGSIKLTNAVTLAKLPVELQPDWVERAMTQSPAEFVPSATAALKKYREDLRAGRTPGVAVFEPVQLLQKLSDIKAVHENPTDLARELIAKAQPKTPEEIFALAIAWTLRSDPISIEHQRKKWELAEAEKKKKKEDAAAERTKKKEEAAKLAASLV